MTSSARRRTQTSPPSPRSTAARRRPCVSTVDQALDGPDDPAGEDGVDADAAGDVPVGGALEDVGHAVVLPDPAVDHHRHPVAEGERLDPVVRDDDRRDAEPHEEGAQLAAELLPGRAVEGRERLVEEEEPRARGRWRGRGRPAAAARPRAPRAAGRRGLRASGARASPPSCGPRGPAGIAVEAEGDVLVRRTGAGRGRSPGRGGRRGGGGPGRRGPAAVSSHVSSAVDDRPLVGAVEAGEGAQNRRLSRARGAEEDRHGAVVAGEDEVGVDRRSSPEPPHEAGFERCGHAATVRRWRAYVTARTAKETARRTSDVAPGRVVVEGLDVVVDGDRDGPGLARDVPADHQDDPELAEGVGERENDAGDDPGAGEGEDDAAKRPEPGRAERGGGVEERPVDGRERGGERLDREREAVEDRSDEEPLEGEGEASAEERLDGPADRARGARAGGGRRTRGRSGAGRSEGRRRPRREVSTGRSRMRARRRGEVRARRGSPPWRPRASG